MKVVVKKLNEEIYNRILINFKKQGAKKDLLDDYKELFKNTYRIILSLPDRPVSDVVKAVSKNYNKIQDEFKNKGIDIPKKYIMSALEKISEASIERDLGISKPEERKAKAIEIWYSPKNGKFLEEFLLNLYSSTKREFYNLKKERKETLEDFIIEQVLVEGTDLLRPYWMTFGRNFSPSTNYYCAVPTAETYPRPDEVPNKRKRKEIQEKTVKYIKKLS